MATLIETYKVDIAHDGDFIRDDGEGDIQTVSGLENLKAALFRRLITSPGSVPHRPTYGVGIKDFKSIPATIAIKRELARRIDVQFGQDPRVEEVVSVSMESEDNTPQKTKITVRVKPVGYTESDMVFMPFGGELE